MVEVTLTLFGPLRAFGPRQLALPDGARVADAKRALAALLPDAAAIIGVSAFGTDTQVLRDDAPLTSGAYAVLPPVSGG